MNKILANLLFFSLILFAQACATNNESDEDDTQNEISATELEILNLVNEYRVSNGLAVLTMDTVVWRYATEHTLYQINLGDINHDNFSERMDDLRAEIGGSSAAENVAFGYDSPETVVQGWINSEGHRLNILGDYNLTGVSARQSQNGDWYYTQIFIKK